MEPEPRKKWPFRVEMAGVFLILLASVLIRLPTLDQPLLEAHQFRQTQTAFTTLMYTQEGVDLFHPKVPVFGPPFEVPFEFPFFQLAALVPIALGLPIDAAMRTTGLFFFLLTALLLWGLVREVRGKTAGLACFTIFIFMPHGLLWGRTSMIEYLATAGAVAYVWSGIRWREDRRPMQAIVSVIAGTVAMLTKVTTGVFWILPLIAYRTRKEKEQPWGWFRSRVDPVLIGLVSVPVALTLLWTRHADAIKARNPLAAWLTSEALSQWNFGTAEQRLDADQWLIIIERIQLFMTGFWPWLLIPLAVLAVWNKQRLFWVATGLTVVLPVAVFFNLHVVHDYYQAAITPSIAAILGGAFAWFFERFKSPAPKPALVLIFVVWLGALAYSSRWYWGVAYEPIMVAQAVPVVAEIRSHIGADEVPILEDYGWSPHTLYYARRKGMMLSVAPESYFESLPPAGTRFLVANQLTGRAIVVLKNRSWTGVVGAHTYLMANDVAEMGNAPLLASDDVEVLSGRFSSRALANRPITIRCDDQPVDLPRGRGSTWIRLAGVSEGSVGFGNEYGALPIRELIIVRRTFPGESLSITCNGPPDVTIQSIFDGPEP